MFTLTGTSDHEAGFWLTDASATEITCMLVMYIYIYIYIFAYMTADLFGVLCHNIFDACRISG